MARLVHGLREVAAAFGHSGNGEQRSARNALPDALIGQHEECVGTLDYMWNEHGTGYIETELIAPQRGFAPAVLFYFVRYGIDNVVTEIFIDTAVPE